MDETIRVPFESWKARPTPAALIALLEASRPLVYTLCHRVLRHPQDAEDASQLVLLHLIDKVGEIRDTTHYRHWIHRVCLHLSLNLKRSRNRRREHEREKAGLAATAMTADPADSVYDHLATLEAESRNLLINRYLEQRSVQDLAAAGGCSTVTLWKKLEKAREELLQSLTRSGFAIAIPDLNAILESSLPVPSLSGGLSPVLLAKAGAVASRVAGGVMKAKSLAAVLLLGLAGAAVVATATWRSRLEPSLELSRGAARPSRPLADAPTVSTEASDDSSSPSPDRPQEVTAETAKEPDQNTGGSGLLPAFIRLMKNQNSDGSWGDGKALIGDRVLDRTGVTSLALLAFLGAGYSQLSKDTYEGWDAGQTVRRALAHLLKGQREDGSFASEGDPMIDQAITALAISEAYGMTASQPLKEPAQRGIQALLKLQSSDGSWGSPMATHWAAEALTSALLSELSVDADVLERSKNYVRSQLDAGPNLPAMLGNIFLNHDKTHPAVAQTVAAVSAAPPDPTRPDMIYCYLASLTLFQYDGPEGKAWKEWSTPMRDVLIRSQQDGFWQGRTHSDTIVQSSLATLSLEVFYRYANVSGSAGH